MPQNQSIVQKLDQMLNSNALDTRAGLQFMGELVKDAFIYIEKQSLTLDNTKDQFEELDRRIKAVEQSLGAFLAARTEEQKEAKVERSRWRWAIITPTIGLFFTTLGLLISLWVR